MGKRLYVGNLPYTVDDGVLQEMFSAQGTVQSAQVVMDRETGRSKGFGFVEMSSDQEAQAAISAWNGQERDGRALTVNEARPREERSGAGASRGSGGQITQRRFVNNIDGCFRIVIINVFCFIERVSDQTSQHGANLMKLKLERTDDSEISTAAAQAPEQVGILRCARSEKVSIGRDYVG